MKRAVYLLIAFVILSTMTNAQIKPENFKPFIGKHKIISSSGPGLSKTSGDILLELNDKPDEETLMLLRKNNGKLTKVAENSSILMGKEMIGNSGNNYPELSGNKLSVDYTLGSNSAISDISIVFEKNGNGNYDFKEYKSITKNYGVENLFARERITVQQTGKISFIEATENIILKKAKIRISSEDDTLPEEQVQYAKYISEDWRLATHATGDLNLDGYKKDLILFLYNENDCMIQLLLQQKGGNYKQARLNTTLIVPDQNFNINNFRIVIKNGYFTIEERTATDDTDFDHRYITFKYDAAQKNWSLHRYDVEHFSGFNAKPSKEITHLTTKDFGQLNFETLDYTPGDYHYEPSLATISGTLVEKQYYGRPNYGETPDKDEKVMILVLIPDYPVNVLATPDQPDPETADKTIRNIREIQVYSTDKKVDLSKYLNQKIILQGLLIPAQSGGHYTKAVMELKKISL